MCSSGCFYLISVVLDELLETINDVKVPVLVVVADVA